MKAQVYTRKPPGGTREKNQGMRVVMDLTQELRGQNVTCDNFFTSYMLDQALLKRNITMLGTMRRNKTELPNLSRKAVHHSQFYFTKDTTVVSYIPKKNRNVVLMSTAHKSKEATEETKDNTRLQCDKGGS